MENTLYSKLAKDFSRTRSAPWNGWNMLIDRGLIPEKPLRVLDIGCGNGRFLKFIQEHREIEYYLGIDNSTELLEEADTNTLSHKCNFSERESTKSNFKVEYQNIDINNQTWNIAFENAQSGFDLIVAFGIQHHLTSFENREYLLKQIHKLLKTDDASKQENSQAEGLGVVTYWQFFKHERYKTKIKKLPGENNYSMSFGENQDARFCHFTDLDEIIQLEGSSKLDLVDDFLADGREDNENIYRVYRNFPKVRV